MNRRLLISILLPAMGAILTASAQETNSSPALDWSSFQTIAQKNIFDPTRSGRGERVRGSRPRPVIVRSFTFRGTIGDGDVALFTGDGAGKGYLKIGDTINGYKVMKIPVSYTDPTVVLTDPAGVIVLLKEGESMRREEEGPWTKSEQPAALAVASFVERGNSDAPPAAVGSGTDTPPEESSAPASAGPAGESDILKRLRLKREQEDK